MAGLPCVFLHTRAGVVSAKGHVEKSEEGGRKLSINNKKNDTNVSSGIVNPMIFSSRRGRRVTSAKHKGRQRAARSGGYKYHMYRRPLGSSDCRLTSEELLPPLRAWSR